MSKLSNEDMINLYNERKTGVSIASLCSKYDIGHKFVEYLIRLIDKNKHYAMQDKENEIKNETIKRLEEKNILKAELKYSKKLRVVV